MTLWGSHFSEELNKAAWALNESISFDQRMALQDVRGSMAWAKANHMAGVLSEEEKDSILSGLVCIMDESETGKFIYKTEDEDIHTAVERRLGEIIGDLAGKLHTGRSRNDQVATDFRLWMLDNLPVIINEIKALQSVFIWRAEEDMDIIMPGYTHLQRAQPVLLSHWWLSFFWPLQRDLERLIDLTKRVSILPLGSAALAGTTFPVDRYFLTEELGFSEPSQNSLDAVSDRDFAAEFLFCASMLSIHLSKLSEAIILFSTAEFGYFVLSDAFSTGSSLMPQKRNPDMFELARGKSGTLIGTLMGLLTTLKGLPSTYDKDLQEDKPAVFSAFDTLKLLLPVIGGAVKTLSVRPEKMQQALDSSLMATDIADYLVKKGIPFRQSYGITGKAVRFAAENNKALADLTLQEWQSFHESIKEDILETLSPESSINNRNVFGGTGKKAVLKQIEQAKNKLAL